MTTPPLPASPCLRVKLDYTQADGFLAGSRFYVSYAGAAPTAGNCATLAAGIEEAWVSDLAGIIDSNYALTEVDVLDISTNAGASGVWSGSESGTRSGTPLTAAAATNVEFDIARRYRGGKPRMYLPPGVTGDIETAAKWASAFITDVNTQLADFFTAIAALDVGAVGALAHVNLSYYAGFTNVTNSSGRTRAAPKYRNTALVDQIQGYACKATIGQQRRRRTATTY